MIPPIEPIKGGQGRSDQEVSDQAHGIFYWIPIAAAMWVVVGLFILKSCGG